MHSHSSLLLSNNTSTWCACSQIVKLVPAITACHLQQSAASDAVQMALQTQHNPKACSLGLPAEWATQMLVSIMLLLLRLAAQGLQTLPS